MGTRGGESYVLPVIWLLGWGEKVAANSSCDLAWYQYLLLLVHGTAVGEKKNNPSKKDGDFKTKKKPAVKSSLLGLVVCRKLRAVWFWFCYLVRFCTNIIALFVVVVVRCCYLCLVVVLRRLLHSSLLTGVVGVVPVTPNAQFFVRQVAG